MSDLTDNVYHTVKHILQTYDGLATTEIDYGNLEAQRDSWKVGRQLKEQKKSDKYLQEIMKQSFVGMFPTRKGLRGFSAWRAFSSGDEVATHDESAILRITKFVESSIDKVYNDFTINFDYNPERKKFNKTVFITNTDASGAFPASTVSTDSANDDVEATFSTMTILTDGVDWYMRAVFSADPISWARVGEYVSYDDGAGNTVSFAEITSVHQSSKVVNAKFTNSFGIAEGVYSGGTYTSMGSSIPKWTTYVGGISDYVTSKAWWDICNESWDRTQIVNPLPRELGDCYWYNDNDDFSSGTGGLNNSAVMFLENLVEWTTRKKFIVTYELPITAANLQLELLDPIMFNDQKYTNSVDRFGWITMIKIIPSMKNPRMEITLILEPYDIGSYNLIIETGSAADTYTERGDQGDDTITEGAQ